MATRDSPTERACSSIRREQTIAVEAGAVDAFQDLRTAAALKPSMQRVHQQR
jgi:hypothetical protein